MALVSCCCTFSSNKVKQRALLTPDTDLNLLQTSKFLQLGQLIEILAQFRNNTPAITAL